MPQRYSSLFCGGNTACLSQDHREIIMGENSTWEEGGGLLDPVQIVDRDAHGCLSQGLDLMLDTVVTKQYFQRDFPVPCTQSWKYPCGSNTVMGL